LNPDVYKEWLVRRKLKVVRTSSTYWVNYGFRVFQAFPYHWVISPSEDELEMLFKGNWALGLRYSTHDAAPIGKVSYHTVVDVNAYSLDQLSPDSRRNVRNGLKHTTISQISLHQLCTLGFPLTSDTLERQGRRGHVSEKEWKDMWEKAEGLPGFKVFGAFVQNELAASVVTFKIDDHLYLLYPQSRTKFLSSRVNNALIYEVTRTAGYQSGTKRVFYGLNSLDAMGSVDEFKFRMGFHKLVVKQRVAFHPWIESLVSPSMLRFTHKAKRLGMLSRQLSKAEGLIRFFIEGRAV
jgi:hypothetical protein